MHVTASRGDEARDHLALDLDHVGQEVLHRRIDLRGVGEVDALRNPIGSDQRNLDRLARDRGRVTVLLEHQVAPKAQPLDHALALHYGRPLAAFVADRKSKRWSGCAPAVR